ncbi:MAG: cytochrome P460 family protein [Acidobacteria bacterium]|nr:cytochrome P460 family protein [Acidobacteriota bacterium]
MWKAWMYVLLLAVPVCSEEARMPAPKYTEKGRLIRPEGYREWMFAGANLGMGYTEGQARPRTTYHNIYLQREAFQRFASAGRFPDKTMLVMEVLSVGTNASINRQGSFQDQLIGIEVALKDESRFPEKWAYFNFIGENDRPLPDAAPFRKEQCWNCHNQHGAVDNVFVQFYPVLREVRKP